MGGLGFSLARKLKIQGPVSVVSTACSSGNYAIARAAEWIFSDVADMVVVGGVDPRSLVVLNCFNRLGAADPEILRPFDENRNGTTLAEGAGVLIVETLESARARGVTPYAEIAGSGWSCDAYHPTAPEPEGVQARNCMTRALAASDKDSADVRVVFAHGTGTQANDLLESGCIADIFPQRPSVTAFKSLIGHSGAGSGAVTVVAAVQAIKSGKIPPTVNTGRVDPKCRARIVLETSAVFDSGAVVVNGFSFGGNNCSLVVQAVEEERT